MPTKLTEHKVAAEKMVLSVTDQFHLLTENTQLSFAVTDQGNLFTTYFGKKLGAIDLSYVLKDVNRASYLADTYGIKNYKVEQLPLTYPSFGTTDLNQPAVHIEYGDDGSRISDFRYISHRYLVEKPALEGLPSTHAIGKVTSLEITLLDAVKNVKLYLTICAFEAYDTFTQSIRLENLSNAALTIDRLMSTHLMFLKDKFEMISLTGAWGREAYVQRKALTQGFQGVSSARGASGHGQNPFVALVDPNTTQNTGEAYGFNLIYSGNFVAGCEVDMHQNTRVQLGINPFDFSWTLEPTESFTTPEVVMTFADKGLNQMSQQFHQFYTDCLVPENFAKKERPVLLNNWEATYFDFDREKLLALADKAAYVGAELFVLDDGWYGRRDDITSGLGDWYPNEEKLGGTLDELISEVQQKGLQFGIWFEPEMICEDSELFRQHPDWMMKVPERTPQIIRSQYVLDLTLTEVQEYLISIISTLLEKYDISYVKWDMNRNFSDIYSTKLSKNRQKELAHRYILALYHILDEITKAHPDVLFESCAGGGGRFDPGMLAYTNQIWASDNTDAIARLATQEGLSYAYPSVTVSGHVSAVPNHQIGRITSLGTRTAVAQNGNFGYELNLSALTESELTKIKADVSRYKTYRKTLQFGQHTRLEVDNPQNEHAWQKSDDKLVIVTMIQTLVKPNSVAKRLRLLDLDDKVNYQDESGKIYTANELMSIGLPVEKPTHDYFAKVYVLTKV